VEELWSPSLACRSAKAHAKADAIYQRSFTGTPQRGSFSLRRGLDSIWNVSS
jgi:hypothetical protein